MPSNKRSNGGRSRKYFHKAARRCKLAAIAEGASGELGEDECQQEQHVVKIRCKASGPEHKERLNRMKSQLITQLNESGGDVASSKSLIDRLSSFYDPNSFDPKQFMTPMNMTDAKLEDMWLMISKPQFRDCLGKNEYGDGMYTLGRMAFDMFRPTQLVCSVQGSFNDINIVDGTDPEAVKHVPKALEADVREGKIPVRTYNIITAFTIEPYNPETMSPDSPNKNVQEPIQAIMTTTGYAMPYPKQNNRYSIWFSGGSIQVISDPYSESSQQWEQIFSGQNMPQRTITERVGLFAAGLLMGATAQDEMDAQGKISYALKRPMAAYIDMIYLDDTMRIMRGNSGSIYVMIRAPQIDDATSYYTAESLESDCSSITMGSEFDSGLMTASSSSLLLSPTPENRPPCPPTRRGSVDAESVRGVVAVVRSDERPSRPPRRGSIEPESIPTPVRAIDERPSRPPRRGSIEAVAAVCSDERPSRPPRRGSIEMETISGAVAVGGSDERPSRPPRRGSVEAQPSPTRSGPAVVMCSDERPSRPTRRGSVEADCSLIGNATAAALDVVVKDKTVAFAPPQQQEQQQQQQRRHDTDSSNRNAATTDSMPNRPTRRGSVTSSCTGNGEQPSDRPICTSRSCSPTGPSRAAASSSQQRRRSSRRRPVKKETSSSLSPPPRPTRYPDVVPPSPHYLSLAA